MVKEKALFVCVHNSARSQMAEALLNNIAGDRFQAESAGLEPGVLSPLAIEAMKDIGIDISENKTRSVFDLFKARDNFAYVITVCDGSNQERCPVFPGGTKKLHWGFGDPASFKGSWQEKLAKTIKVREEIKNKIVEFIKEA